MGSPKHVIEVLMRSGADPSCPNEAGLIPYDLTSDILIQNALLSDRDEISRKVISPMQQVRRELALTPSSKQERELVEDTVDSSVNNEVDASATGIERIADSLSTPEMQDHLTSFTVPNSPPKPNMQAVLVN